MDPLAGAHVTARGPSTRSLAVAVKLKAAPVALVASTVTFAGAVTTGPIVSAAVTVNEGYDPGVTVFQRNGEKAPKAGTQKIPTLYNGLSYGPYAVLEEQARGYVRQAYAAVYPFAQKLCAFDASDHKREQSIDEQLPAGPAPL